MAEVPPIIDRQHDASQSRAWWAFGAACLGAVLLVLGAYSNSLHNSFHFDDNYSIERNGFIRDIRNIPHFFTDARTFSSLPGTATYRPLVTLTFAIDHWIGGGLNPTQFHITQLLLLVTVGALLLALYAKLFESAEDAPWHRWAALFTATLFCVHTGNTQTGNYISARSELLSAIGVLGSFAIYLHVPRSRRWHWYLLPMAIGALAKTPAVVFAPLLLVYKLLIEEQLSVRAMFTRSTWPRVRAALRSTLPALGCGIVLFFFVEGMNAPGQSYGGGPRLQYLLTQTWLWARYVRLFFVPTGLTADTDLTLITTWQDPRVILGLVVSGGLLIALWRASTSRRLRPVAFGLAWFWISLAPASSVFPLAEVTNDHRFFLPFMGLAPAVVWWFYVHIRTWMSTSAAVGRVAPRVAFGLGAVVLAAHAVGTHERNRVWQNEDTLWSDVVAKSPSNGRGLMNYGLTQMQQGHFARAKELFTRAQTFAPNYPILEINLGIVNGAMGDSVTAEQHFERAIALDSNYSGARFYYARWLVQNRRTPEAVPQLQRAITLNPADADSPELLMNIYAALGAERELKALAADTFPFPVANPGFQSLYALGLGFTRQRQHLEAAEAYRAALSFDRNSVDAWNNLGWSLAQLGLFDAAIPAYDNALRVRPDYTLARNNLAAAKSERSAALFRHAYTLQLGGQLDEAIAIYRELLGVSPGWVNVHYNLGHALMSQGRCAEAVPEFQRTLALQPVYPTAHLHLATCFAKLGQPVDAERHRALYVAAGGQVVR